MYQRKEELSNVSADYWIFKDEETPKVEPMSFDYQRADTLVVMNHMKMTRRSLPEIKVPRKSAPPPRILSNRPQREGPSLAQTHLTAWMERNSKKSKKKVRLRVPGEVTPRTEVTPLSPRIDPFENNWLVDTPRVILSEKTMVSAESPLQRELEAFYEEVACVPEDEYTVARKAARELVNFVMRKLNKMEFKDGLKLQKPVYAGSTFDMSQSMEITDVDVLLCFELPPRARIESLQPGYYVINLPKLKDKEKEGLQDDPCSFGRSEDGQYLSSRILSWLFYNLIQKILPGKPNAVLHPYTIQEGKSQIIVTMNDLVHVHLIPATWDNRLEGHLVTRPYMYDENAFSDMMWRYSFTQTEQLLLRTMESADRGARLKVYKVLKALVRVEHTLEGLTGYHIKTVILHTFDSDIDNTPRWQRGNLEACFLNVLRELKHYFTRKCLPHFFIKGQNLLDGMPDRTWSNLKARLSFMVSNPRECVRVLHKRTRLVFDDLHERPNRDSVTSTKTV